MNSCTTMPICLSLVVGVQRDDGPPDALGCLLFALTRDLVLAHMVDRRAETYRDARQRQEAELVQPRGRMNCDRHDRRPVAKRQSADPRPWMLGDLPAPADAALRIDDDETAAVQNHGGRRQCFGIAGGALHGKRPEALEKAAERAVGEELSRR